MLCAVTRCEFLHKLLSNHNKTEFFWLVLRPALISEWKEMNVEGSLILCQVSRIVVSYSTLRLMRFLIMGSWPGVQYKAWVSFCGAGLKSIQKVAGYTYNICPTTVPCLTMLDTNEVQGFQAKVRLWMTFPSGGCIAPSSSMKAFQLGKGFLVSIDLTSLCSVYNLYDVASRKNIHFWWATRSNVNSLYCLWGLWDTSDQQLKARYPT